MGTTMFWSEPNKLFEQTLLKMSPQLAQEGYVGYIDVNCIVNNNGIYPLEFTSRFGYTTIFIQQEGMLTPIGLFLWDLAHGVDPKLKVRSGFEVGVRIVMPPFPFDDTATFESFTKNAVIVFKKGRPKRSTSKIRRSSRASGSWPGRRGSC
jgi:phosphoribosylamine--glycine ligase